MIDSASMLNRMQQGIRRVMRSKKDQVIISFVVIVYDMPLQAQNTVRSLLADYQRGACADDYEVVIVENESSNTISRDFLKLLPANVSYHLRKETQPTPIYAINYGIERAQGKNICVMIDGARLVTPGVVTNMLRGHRLSNNVLVTVPGYHLGFELQQKSVGSGYDVDKERALMESISWPDNGYRLFEIACFSGSSAHGFYLGHSESNCISMSRDVWAALGGYDAKFDMRGGGLVNLDLYKRACEYPGMTHVLLQGEGTFHQFHGGVTTGGDEAKERQKFIDSIKAQYEEIRGQKFSAPETDPVYLGELSNEALEYVKFSATKKLDRLKNNAKK